MTSTSEQDLSNFIRSRLRELKWTQTKLSEVSGVSEGSVSNLLNQKSVPETSTVERIADALNISRQVLLGFLAKEHHGAIAEPDVDPTALYIARRLTGLPDSLRENAIDAVSGVVDSFIRLAEAQGGQTNPTKIEVPMSPRQEMEILNRLSPEVRAYAEGLKERNLQEYQEFLGLLAARKREVTPHSNH